MKKRLSLILAALTTAVTVSLACVPASAAGSNQVDEQYVVEEDGQTVVYIVTYVDPSEGIAGQTVTWYDGSGTKYVRTYKERPQQDPFDFSSYVTWYDEAGNKYVLDQKAQTVTIYDANGNMIAVKPA